MKKRRGYIIFLYIIVLAGFLFVGYQLYSSYLADQITQNYISNNIMQLDFGEEKIKFPLLNSDIGNNEIFLLGETHGVQENYQLDLALFKYLKERTNIKYYLAETGYAQGRLINRYIQTGDEEIIKKIYSYLRGTYAYNKTRYQKLKELRNYYKNLPEGDKFEYLGIDIEHQLQSAFWYMNTLLPEKSIPERIRPVIIRLQQIHKKRQYNREEIKKLSRNIKESIENNSKLYKDYLGKFYWEFKLVNHNIQNRFLAYEGDNFNEIRDRAIYNNFMTVYPYLEKGKFYGMWGDAHTYQKKFNNVDYFASLLTKTPEFNDDILSIKIHYRHCKRMVRNPYDIRSLNSRDPFNITNDIAVDTKGALIKLNSEDSPFEGRDYILVGSFFKIFKNSTTDYIQYLILLNEGIATEPFEK